MGKETKLSSKDKFLLTMMKLRLGLQTDAVFQREVAPIYFFLGYEQWQSTSRHFLFLIANLETVLATSPDRFRCFKNLIGIIDCA